MQIRKAGIEEAEGIRSLIVEAVDSCSEDFDTNGRKYFLESISTESIQRRILSNEHFSLVCDIDGFLAGLITVRSCEKIDQLFVHPLYRRRGIAKGLWQEAKRLCEEKGGSGSYWVKSSSMGVPVYQGFGFKIIGDRKCENGISYYPMTLNHRPGAPGR